jgi:hypothetical protein
VALHGQTQSQHLVAAGKGAGHVHAVLVLVQQGARAGEPHRPGGDAFAHQRLHLRQLRVRWQIVLAVAALAHDVCTHRAVGHLSRHVDGARPALQGVEVLRKRLPLPVDALGQGGAGNVLDTLHQLDQKSLLPGPHRRETDAAVAHHHGGDAVPARRRQVRIPGGLAIVVGVHVHPARRHQTATGINLAAAATGYRSDLNDAPTGNGNVAVEALPTRPVDDGAAAYDQIVHDSLP